MLELIKEMNVPICRICFLKKYSFDSDGWRLATLFLLYISLNFHHKNAFLRQMIFIICFFIMCVVRCRMLCIICKLVWLFFVLRSLSLCTFNFIPKQCLIEFKEKWGWNEWKLFHLNEYNPVFIEFCSKHDVIHHLTLNSFYLQIMVSISGLICC